MPSRKKTRHPPKFSFVATEFDANVPNRLKKHSGAARSHAAYWGGAVKRQHQGYKQIAEKEHTIATPVSNRDKDSTSRYITTPDSSCVAAPSVRRQRSPKLQNGKVISLPLGTGSALLCHIKTDNLQHLPAVPSGSELRVLHSLMAC